MYSDRVLENISVESFEIIPASEQIKYPYVLFIPPNNPEKVTNLMMWGAGSIEAESPLNQAEAILTGSIPDSIKTLCLENQIACFTPVLPRVWRGVLDAQILSKSTIISDENCPDFYKRPDLEILKMVRQIISTLENNHYQKTDKIIVAGISAGANQANRMSILYPDLIKAAGILCAGDFIYPTESIEGHKLNYPFGLSDRSKITGQRFDLDTFIKIPHFFYVGKNDLKKERDPFAHDLEYDIAQIEKLAPILGINQVERTYKYVDYIRALGMNCEFEVREDLGHLVDTKTMRKYIEFVKSVL